MKDLIGFFDSGVGGVSVLREAVRLMPNEHFLFYGDNANAPYGTRTLEEIRALSAAGVARLLDRGVKAIVIACNTATSAYAAIIRAEHPELPIVGMEPALKPAHFARRGGEVLALATAATLRLEKYERLMERYGEGVISVVGDGLVELVEEGKSDSPEAEMMLRRLLRPYLDRQIDAIVLGCTHYPFLRTTIQAIMPGVPLFDGRLGTAKRLESLLNENRLRSNDRKGSVEFQTSGGPDKLRLLENMMNYPL